jgi:hypothetical protein
MRTGNRISLLVVFALFLLMLICRTWKPHERPISWDVAGYYLYLPNSFIYHDPGMKNFNRIDSLRNTYQFSPTFYQVYHTPQQSWVIKYTMGNSVLYAPFFFVGHIMAGIQDYPQDGFSKPYQQCLMWGTLIYGLLALWFARKILLHFFTDKIVAFTLLMIVLGTNLFFILSMDNLQPHYNLFFLYTVFIWATIVYHQNPGFKKAFLLGVVGGLIVLARPTDVVIGLIPLFWGIKTPADAWKKLRSQFRYLVFAGVVAGIVFFPQLLYWKKYAGEWLYNSYNNPGEGLDLWSPHTWPFLFSYRKGWLVYTPMVIFMMLGILISIRSKEKIFVGLLLFFVVNLWLVSSWTCWWYAASFSSRAMVQSYAVLMIPLGYFVQFISSKGKLISLSTKSMMVLVMCLCVFQTWQYAEGILTYDRMTRAYYWRVFGKTHKDPANDQYLLKDKFLGTDTIPDRENFRIVSNYLFDFNNQYGFDTETASRFVQLEGETDYSLKLDSAHVFYTIIEDSCAKMTDKYYAYIRVEGDIQNEAGFQQNPVELIRTTVHKNQLYGYESDQILRYNTSTERIWRHFTYDYILPDLRSKKDLFKTYFWLRGSKPVYIKNLKVAVLEAKEFPELE